MIATLITWFPTFFKFRLWIGFGVLLVLIPVSYGWGYWDGHSAGKARVEYKTIEKIIEVEKKREKKKIEVQRLNDVDRVKRYCRWVRGASSYDHCVRTVKPVD